MQPLISVIVPVYNVEPYLDQCVESIVNQTYKNLEIILVDDGSPDNCPAMCDKWAEIDSRIIVIHKENGGLSDARNSGLKIATGEYIGFVDSDDWIAYDFFEKLYEPCKIYGCEISACDVEFTESREAQIGKHETGEYRIGSPEDALHDLIRGIGYRAIVCNKLFNSHILNGELFPKDKLHEDEFFTYKIIGKSCSTSYYTSPLYFYFQRDTGIVRSISPKHLDALEAYIERIVYLETSYPKLLLYDKLTFCKTCVLFCEQVSEFPKSSKRLSYKIIKHARQRIGFTFSELMNLSIKDLIYVLGSKITPILLANILKKRT